MASTRRAPDHPLLLLGLWVLSLFLLLVFLVNRRIAFGYDTHAYWHAWHTSPMYGASPNTKDAFLYSPAFAQLIWPLAQLPWPCFAAIWTVGGLLVYAWLLWPVSLKWRVPLLVLCVPEAGVGNIWPLLALVAVFAFEAPSLWAFTLLTKVTAATGVIWFGVRREWGALVRLAVAVLAVTAVSVAISPSLWLGWLRLLVGGGNGGVPSQSVNIPLSWRLPVAVVLAFYAARRGKRGLLALTVGLAAPVFTLTALASNLFLLTALPRLRLRSASVVPDEDGVALRPSFRVPAPRGLAAALPAKPPR